MSLSGNRLLGCVPPALWRVWDNDLGSLDLPTCQGLTGREDSSDREVLVALYNATGGLNWTENTAWLTDEPMARWHGVEAVRRVGLWWVRRLELTGNGLSGEIPAELGNMGATAGAAPRQATS